MTAPKKRLVPPAFLKKNTTGDCLDTFHGNFGTTKNKCCDKLFLCALKVVLVLGGSRISPYTVHYKMENNNAKTLLRLDQSRFREGKVN